jgi:acylphosphatase
MADLVRYFGTATGRVQGVGFRMYVQQHAMELDMTGWVKNMDDGSVTMEVPGYPGRPWTSWNVSSMRATTSSRSRASDWKCGM